MRPFLFTIILGLLSGCYRITTLHYPAHWDITHIIVDSYTCPCTHSTGRVAEGFVLNDTLLKEPPLLFNLE